MNSVHVFQLSLTVDAGSGSCILRSGLVRLFQLSESDCDDFNKKCPTRNLSLNLTCQFKWNPWIKAVVVKPKSGPISAP